MSEQTAAEVAAMALELSKLVFRSAWRLTGGDRAEADDLVQEAFTAALLDWDKIGRWPREGQLAWLRRVAANKKIDRWRRGNRVVPVAEVSDARVSDSAETVALDPETLGQFDPMLRKMPPERRKIAFLHWYCQWTTRQIAEWNAIAESTVRTHLNLALRQINQEVQARRPFIDDIPDDEIPGSSAEPATRKEAR